MMPETISRTKPPGRPRLVGTGRTGTLPHDVLEAGARHDERGADGVEVRVALSQTTRRSAASNMTKPSDMEIDGVFQRPARPPASRSVRSRCWTTSNAARANATTTSGAPSATRPAGRGHAAIPCGRPGVERDADGNGAIERRPRRRDQADAAVGLWPPSRPGSGLGPIARRSRASSCGRPTSSLPSVRVTATAGPVPRRQGSAG